MNTKEIIASQQAINRKLWAKENGRMHSVDANRLIAEFMGLSHCSEGWITIPYHGREEVAEEEIVDELRYHTSWDWLMPVIESIDHLQHEPIQGIEDALATRHIGDTYKAVVEFINQYNDEHIEPCDECGYYEDAVACHYEDCQKLNTNDEQQ